MKGSALSLGTQFHGVNVLLVIDWRFLSFWGSSRWDSALTWSYIPLRIIKGLKRLETLPTNFCLNSGSLVLTQRYMSSATWRGTIFSRCLWYIFWFVWRKTQGKRNRFVSIQNKSHGPSFHRATHQNITARESTIFSALYCSKTWQLLTLLTFQEGRYLMHAFLNVFFKETAP